VGIVEEDIARVRAETDFFAVANEHMQLKRVGTQYTGLCPFHAEKSPSFSLNPALGVYYCFGCGVRGDAITFVRELNGLGFAEAVESLAVRAGITLRYDDAATGRDHQRRAQLYDALAQAVAWYHERLLRAPDAAAARRYLRTERGYDGDLVRKYQLGWAPEGRDHLLRSLKLPRAALVDAGLAQVNDQGRYADFFRGRLLFPILDQGGRPIGAGGRILPGGRGPKYKNTAGTAVYDKSKVLYGLNWAKVAITAKDQIVVCEGYTDVIGLHSAGVEEAVATCGTALADGHIRALVRFARRIVLAYDADAAGQSAAEHYYGWEQRYGVEIRVAALPAGSDPADLARRDPAALQAAVAAARPYLAFRLERLFARSDLDTPEGRVRVATSALGLIAGHPNDLVRDQYLMEVADRCRIEPGRLRSMPVPASDEATADADRNGRTGGPGGGGRRTIRSEGPRPTGRASTGGASSDRSSERGRAPTGSARHPPGVAGEDEEADGRSVRLYPQEAAALRLAIHHPQAVAARLQGPLFAHPVNRAAFCALASAATFGEAVAAADPQTADLLGRLAVEDTEDDPDDVMVRLVEVAARRALLELDRELRAAPVSDHAGYVQTMTWLKQTREALRTTDGTPVGIHADPDLEAERLLVAWFVDREQAFDDQGGPQDNGTASAS
jgi:DNA primase